MPDFTTHYRTLGDDELSQLWAQCPQLVFDAQAALQREMLARGLPLEAPQSVPVFHVPAPAPSTHTWRIRDAVVIGLLLWFTLVLLNILYFFYLNRFFGPLHLTKWNQQTVAELAIGLVQIGCAVLYGARLARVRFGTNLSSSIGWRPSRHLKLCCCLGVSLSAVVAVTGFLLYGVAGRARTDLSALTIALYFSVYVLGAPFIEECYFRGILFVAVSNRFGKVASATITTLAFVLIHPKRMFTLVAVLALGAAAVITRIRTKSVADCFGLHASYNAGLFIFEALAGLLS